METNPRIVRCPMCKKATKLTSANPYRPFCSERCKTMDLGSWADESYKIPARLTESDFQELEEIMEMEKKPPNPDQ